MKSTFCDHVDYYDHLRPIFAQLESSGVGLCPTVVGGRVG